MDKNKMKENAIKLSLNVDAFCLVGSMSFAALKTVFGGNDVIAALTGNVMNYGGAGFILGSAPIGFYLAVHRLLKYADYSEEWANALSFVTACATIVTFGGALYPGNAVISLTANAATTIFSLAVGIHTISAVVEKPAALELA
jgi:hypothetical protein